MDGTITCLFDADLVQSVGVMISFGFGTLLGVMLLNSFRFWR